MDHSPNSQRMCIEVSWKTIFKVLSGILLAVVAIKLWPLLKLLVVAILLAVPLYRLVGWVCRKGWPRWAAILVSMLTLVVAVLSLPALIAPIAINQASDLGKNLPRLQQQLAAKMPPGALRNLIDHAGNLEKDETLQRFSHQALSTIRTTMDALLSLVLITALTVYLIADGPRALQWLITFFPQEQHQRVAKGLDKIGDRVVAFIVGQSIISGLFATYTFVVLWLLHVPMAVLLALLAGMLDVLPVVGISISLLLGALMGLTVSPTTSLIVVACYVAYHIFENYFLIPKIYGRNLRLSTLVVLLSMIGGVMVAGIVGAIAILPIVAAYPALESLWLSRQLEPEVVKDHQAQLRAA
jgi:predicted PurR-regulated permease PerM